MDNFTPKILQNNIKLNVNKFTPKILQNNIKVKTNLNRSNQVKGICYFDIDDTLTTAKGNIDEIIQECLDQKFAVGIITASNRTVEDICSGDKAGGYQNASWMSNKLCKQFNHQNQTMFNSLIRVGGSNIFPLGYPNDIYISYGKIKGFDMIYGKNKFYPYLKDNMIVLFDDNPSVLRDVKKYNSDLEVVCSHPKCGGTFLTKELVKNKLISMCNEN